MFNLLRSVFKRFADVHAVVEKPGRSLLAETDQIIGQIEVLALRDNRIVVEGWADSNLVTFVVGDASVKVVPHLSRADVATATAQAVGERCGFTLTVPVSIGNIRLVLNRPDGRFIFHLEPFGETELRRSRLSTLGPFLRALVRVAPACIHWLVRKDAAAKARIKTALSMTSDFTASALLPPNLFVQTPAAINCTNPITIVLPIYNALDLLPEVLQRIVQNTDVPWRMIVVEDYSSDDKVRPYLRIWHGALEPSIRALVELVENDKNIGFVQSVNKALKRAVEIGEHVVLLNSDAMVPAGWASRIIRPIVRDSNVATVTPMSNDAEIFSAPIICQGSHLRTGDIDVIDSVARRLNPTFVQSVAPTGVGFCMAMNKSFVQRMGQFDTVFDRGYGEEVDWCQQARSLGGSHVGIGNLFVEHRAGASFGLAQKAQLIRANSAIIRGRYPDYDREVQDFIRHDSMVGARLCLAVAWAARRAGPELAVFVAHAQGGGAELYLQARLSNHIKSGCPAIIFRVGGRYRWQIEVHSELGTISAGTENDRHLVELLKPVDSCRFIYSCAVGFPNPAALPDLLLGLFDGKAVTVEVLFHDYFTLSPSHHLLSAHGEYKGVPDVLSNDPAHQFADAAGRRVSLRQWREAWGRFLRKADELVVFSQNSRELVGAAYPELADRVVLRPHRLLQDAPFIPYVASKRTVIAALGNISPAKGAAILAQLSRLVCSDSSVRLMLIGNLDPNYKMVPPSVVYGSYRLDDLPTLVQEYGITDWLIPSVCPETFSYTTHEALATGLPVWCFDVGAQADAVKHAVASGRPGGVVKPVAGPQMAAAMLEAIVASKIRMPLGQAAE